MDTTSQLFRLAAASACLCLAASNADAQNGVQRSVAYFPEFYHHQPEKKGDTTFHYECYSDHRTVVHPMQLRSEKGIEKIMFVKSYTPPVAPGLPQPTLTKNLVQFEKISANAWSREDAATKDYQTLTVDPKKIVRTDSTVIPASSLGPKQVNVRHYYKVTYSKPTAAPAHNHNHGHDHNH